MKKIMLTVLLFLVCSSFSPVFAIDFIIGAKSGYFIWEPYMKEMEGSGVEDIDRGSGVLYGPVFSILFTPDISLSIAGLTGKQSTNWSSNDESKYWFGAKRRVNGTYYVDIERTDIDSALSYRLSKNFKIFVGYKYQHIKTSLRATIRTYRYDNGDEELYEGKSKFELPAHGPALGVGYSLPLDGGYFIASNLSAIYMWSEFNVKEDRWDIYTPESGTFGSPYSTNFVESYNTKQVGINFEPSVGVKVGERAIYTLGFRFQWMRTKFVDDVVWAPSGWMNDYTYGVFVSVLFVL